jgi:hypothetical protein
MKPAVVLIQNSLRVACHLEKCTRVNIYLTLPGTSCTQTCYLDMNEMPNQSGSLIVPKLNNNRGSIKVIFQLKLLRQENGLDSIECVGIFFSVTTLQFASRSIHNQLMDMDGAGIF